MSQVTLPFTTDVEAKAYQYSAHALGAIKASIRNPQIWSAGKFMSVFFQSNNQLHMNDADFWSIGEGVTHQECMIINPTADYTSRKELLELIKHKIHSGYYIVGMYDEYFIPHKKDYQKSHFIHDYLLYGYDDGVRSFKSVGYLSTLRYETYDIPYDSYLDSLTLCDRNNLPLYFRLVDGQYIAKLPITDIVCNLKDFLSSNNNLPNQKCQFTRLYGISGIDGFGEYIDNLAMNVVDLKNSMTYMEYFQYMYSRMKTISNSGYLIDQHLLNNYHNDLVLPAKRIHNMCMKFNITGDKDLLSRTADLIQTLNRKEEENIKLLLDILS